LVAEGEGEREEEEEEEEAGLRWNNSEREFDEEGAGGEPMRGEEVLGLDARETAVATGEAGVGLFTEGTVLRGALKGAEYLNFLRLAELGVLVTGAGEGEGEGEALGLLAIGVLGREGGAEGFGA
jgi:hypothetical protein